MDANLPTHLRNASEIPHYDDETDVLVVGLGCAGASAVMEACDAGADVLAIERAGGGGGTSANSGGLIYMGGGTPVQKACGFDDTPDEMFSFLAASAGDFADAEKIRPFCERSVEHFHWFEAQGMPFKRSSYPEPSMESPTDDCLVYSGGEDAAPYNAIARPAPRGHKPQTEGKAGPFFMQRMLEAVERRPAKLCMNTSCETLIVERDGRVSGAVAREAGKDRFIRARRGVILAAGGFTMNDEMLQRHVPLLLRCNMRNATDGDDGRAIRMAQAAGGDVLRMDQAEVALPITVPRKLSKGLILNARGQRFINEDTYLGHIGIEALFGQGGAVWMLVDDATYGRSMVGLQPAFVGDSIEEVEREAGLPEGALQGTVAMYNAHAARGEDPLFGKRAEFLQPLTSPPYALLACGIEDTYYAGMTLGGVRTRASGEVLTPDGEAIPGLFAAGRTVAIFPGPGYAASGISLADGTFFGRWAGRTAAASL